MFWSWWIGGLSLAAVAVVHWYMVNRMMAVSGRCSALVNRLRFGRRPDADVDPQELIEALRAATREAAGEQAVESAAPPTEYHPGRRRPQSVPAHVAFFLALTVGGFLAATTSDGVSGTAGLRSSLFPESFGDHTVVQAAVLLVAGALVGFGTRMASGCTSGHGLCGVSRFQIGALVATASFFAAGVAVSFLLGLP